MVAPEVTIPEPVWDSVVVSRGSIVGDDLRECVVVANGNIDLRSVSRSVVISDGEVTIRGPAYHSVIISRGDARLMGVCWCAAVAGGQMISIHPWKSHRDRVETLPNHSYRGGVPNPFGLVRFTSLTDLGVDTVGAWGEPVRVAASLPGGFFRHGSFHVGDEIVRVDETPIRDAADFRRRVRDAAAVGRKCVVTATRAGRPFTVRSGA